MNVLLADPETRFTSAVLDSWKLEDATLNIISELSDLIGVIKKDTYELIFVSTDFLQINEIDSISWFKEHQPGIEIVVLCDGKSVQKAENALSKGASSYLLKPMDASVLENTARRSMTRSLNRKSYRLMEDHVLEDLLGDTPDMKKMLRTLYKIAPTTSTIVITGESGTGKEFVANIIHRLSKRAEEPFVTVNCGAIPENIVESELFGSKKGAFTGATVNKKGLFEEADSGTLFLDEIGELALNTQVKLLRFLQSREIRAVGETQTRHIDTRIIAATNKDLGKAIKEGNFREDLFYRLNTFQIHLPPLRERKQTIPNLVKFFVLKYNQEHDRHITHIQSAAQIALSTYEYPGNIRELENIIEHAIVMAEGEAIRLEDLPEFLRITPEYQKLPSPESKSKPDSQNLYEILSLSEVERSHIMHALSVLKNNQTEAAKKLGVSRSTLWRKIQEHKIKI
jgi:DNA-binding NtrC family response regulator